MNNITTKQDNSVCVLTVSVINEMKGGGYVCGFDCDSDRGEFQEFQEIGFIYKTEAQIKAANELDESILRFVKNSGDKIFKLIVKTSVIFGPLLAIKSVCCADEIQKRKVFEVISNSSSEVTKYLENSFEVGRVFDYRLPKLLKRMPSVPKIVIVPENAKLIETHVLLKSIEPQVDIVKLMNSTYQKFNPINLVEPLFLGVEMPVPTNNLQLNLKPASLFLSAVFSRPVIIFVIALSISASASTLLKIRNIYGGYETTSPSDDFKRKAKMKQRVLDILLIGSIVILLSVLVYVYRYQIFPFLFTKLEDVMENDISDPVLRERLMKYFQEEREKAIFKRLAEKLDLP